MGEPWTERTSEVISMEQMFEDTLKQWADVTTPVSVRALTFMQKCVCHGSTFIRTFADIDPAIGLEADFNGVFDARSKLAGLADIRVIAFPQSAYCGGRAARN